MTTPTTSSSASSSASSSDADSSAVGDTFDFVLTPGSGVSHPSVTQRAIGALVGSACADALGAPFEFGTAGDYKDHFPKPVFGGTGELTGGGSFGWAPGEFTDDTQMALCLAVSLIERGGLDCLDVFERWQTWAGTARDVGINTRVALSGKAAGAARRAHSATGGRSAANGALMRVTPVPLAFLADEELCVAAARAQAAVTHFDPAAGWGAALAAVMIRRLILGDAFEDALAAGLAILPSDQLEVFGPLLASHWSPHRDSSGLSNGSVWACLAQAVWAVRDHDGFHDAVTAAIDLGGDTDTVACVTGALAGARWSIQQVPSRWTTYVHGTVPTSDGIAVYRNRDLQDVALTLIGSRSPSLTPFVDTIGPTEIARGLWAADLRGASLTPDHFAVVSAALPRGLFDNHPVRREVFLVDQPGEANTDAAAALRDAVYTVEAFLAEGHDVVVHCHAGRSRTGLVLKAWAMRNLGLDERQAHAWVTERWPYCADWNESFPPLLTEEFGNIPDQ